MRVIIYQIVRNRTFTRFDIFIYTKRYLLWPLGALQNLTRKIVKYFTITNDNRHWQFVVEALHRTLHLNLKNTPSIFYDTNACTCPFSDFSTIGLVPFDQKGLSCLYVEILLDNYHRIQLHWVLLIPKYNSKIFTIRRNDVNPRFQKLYI